MNKPNDRIAIFNVYGHRNTGDAMLLESLVDVLIRAKPNANITGIAFDVESERTWMPEIRWTERIANAASKTAIGRAQQLVSLSIALLIATSRRFLPLKRFLPYEQRAAVDALNEADLAISCPGGYLEDSNRAYLLNVLQVLLAVTLSREVVLAPQSIGPIRSRFGRMAVRYMLRKAKRIFPREPSSIEFMKQIFGSEYEALSEKVFPAGDLAFWYSRSNMGRLEEEWVRLGVDPRKPIVGLTVVDWKFPHHPDPMSAKVSYIGALLLLHHVTSATAYQVVLFNQVTDDLKLGEELGRRNPELIVDRFERDCGIFAAMVAQCSVFIGTRFHSCIFGLIGGVPTGAVAYLPKTSGIMKELGLYEYVADINDVNSTSLIELFDKLEARQDVSRKSIYSAVRSYRDRRGAFIEYAGLGQEEVVQRPAKQG